MLQDTSSSQVSPSVPSSHQNPSLLTTFWLLWQSVCFTYFCFCFLTSCEGNHKADMLFCWLPPPTYPISGRLSHVALCSERFPLYYYQIRLQFITCLLCMGNWIISTLGPLWRVLCGHSCRVLVMCICISAQEIGLFSSCTKFLNDLLLTSLSDDDLQSYKTLALNCKLLMHLPSGRLYLEVHGLRSRDGQSSGHDHCSATQPLGSSCWLCLCFRCNGCITPDPQIC